MAGERWEIDNTHSGIHFSVRHLVVAKVRGQFTRWSGNVTAEAGEFARATVQVVIDASTISTGVEERDRHLRSPDFLDVAAFPEITFESRSVEALGAGRYTVIGDLTLHGVTRQVPLDVQYAGKTQDPWGHERAGFSAKASLERKHFGLDWNQVLEAGGLLVGELVEIEIEIEAVRPQAALTP